MKLRNQGRKLLGVAVAACLTGAAAPALAITDETPSASMQFSFVPPGARALGMGGAFVGRADDATAAYTNPAGLTQLSQFEISAEGRTIDYSTEYPSGGTFGVDPLDLSGIEYSRAESDVKDISYLSVVWPQDSWAIAVFRHKLASYETLIDDVDSISGPGDFVIPPAGAGIDLDIVNYGLSAAVELGDTVSVGGSLIHSQLDLSSANLFFDGGFATGQFADDKDWSYNVGITWKFAPQWQLGGVYRKGPEFDADAVLVTVVDGEVDQVFPGFPKRTSFNAPSVFGLGLSYQPTDQWTFALDVNRVFYSDLSDGLNSGFRADDDVAAVEIDALGIDDGTEIRLGAEYTILSSRFPVSLRGGLWHDPEHTLRFDGEPDLDSGNAIANAVLFSTGDDELHYTFGIGAVFGRFQIDAAADFSENVDTVSVSGVFRFD